MGGTVGLIKEVPKNKRMPEESGKRELVGEKIRSGK
jgi:hypothetical protein